MLTIGTHMSIAGGIAKTAENVVKMEAIQEYFNKYASLYCVFL